MEAESAKAEIPEDAIPILSVDDSQKIEAGIVSVELDIPLLAREDLGVIEHRESIVYFNQRFKELSDMVNDTNFGNTRL